MKVHSGSGRRRWRDVLGLEALVRAGLINWVKR